MPYLCLIVISLCMSDCRKRKRRPISMHKKRRKLLTYCPTKDPARRLEQMASLATALTALQMKFTNDLTYVASMALRSANQASLEKGGMQVQWIFQLYNYLS